LDEVKRLVEELSKKEDRKWFWKIIHS
jgi:hypothetical protein